MNPTKLRKYLCLSEISINIGLFLLFAGVGIYFYADFLFKKKMHDNLKLTRDSKGFKLWQNPPATIYRKYYIFDVKNPLEVEQGIQKPYLVQKGPYVYKEVTEKRNIEILGFEIIHFSPVTSYYFESSLSNGSENDQVTFLNIPAIGMINSFMSGNTNNFTIQALNSLFLLLNTNMFVTKTVGELISGYDDPILALAKIFSPNLIKSDKFSLLNGKNGTIWQNVSIRTGYDDPSNAGKIVSWNGMEKLEYWNSLEANLLNGTDGTAYPPYRLRDDILYSFNPDMCRSYSIKYKKDSQVHGISTYTFHFSQENFYNSTLNPDNFGFCGNDCLGNGVFNISSCYGGANAFISQPHFLNADKKFLDSLNGLAPNDAAHDYELHFEPTTGVAVAGNIRFQINFMTIQNQYIDIVKNIKIFLLPMIWIEEDIKINDDIITQFIQLNSILNLLIILPIMISSIGAFLIVSSIFFKFYAFKKEKSLHGDLYHSIDGNENMDQNSIENIAHDINESTNLLSKNS